MLQHKTPHLSIGGCLSDSFSVWANHLPVLFAASVAVVILSLGTGTLLMGSLYAGLFAMLLKGMRGEKPRFRDVFSRARHFVRFFCITWFALLLTAVGLALLVVPGILVGVWCFYMHLLAADRGTSLDESFVESRKAVKRYGFWKHLVVLAFALAVAVGSVFATIEIASEKGALLAWLIPVVPLLLQPLALGLLASAYRQTLEVEAEQAMFREREFREMRDELQTAHDMQMGLLPGESPEVAGYSLDGICIPANNVGGDYFAYRWLDDGKTRLALVVADVSGKAMEAAVTALRFNEMLRYECRERTAPADILDGLNASLEGQVSTSTFITCCIAVLHTSGGAVEVASAGHCFPYHYASRSGRAVPVEVTGFPLGLPAAVRPSEPYATVRVALQPGDALVLYSDGVVEAHDRNGELYDERRFEQLLGATAGGVDAGHITRTVVRDVDRFIGGAPRTDDVTVVVLKRKA